MVSEPEEWPAFTNYLEDIKTLKESFTRSEIIYVPRTQNSKADRLARSARKQPSFVVHMDSDHPVWFTESVWVCIVDDKKKSTKFTVTNKINQMINPSGIVKICT